MTFYFGRTLREAPAARNIDHDACARPSVVVGCSSRCWVRACSRSWRPSSSSFAGRARVGPSKDRMSWSRATSYQRTTEPRSGSPAARPSTSCLGREPASLLRTGSRCTSSSPMDRARSQLRASQMAARCWTVHARAVARRVDRREVVAGHAAPRRSRARRNDEARWSARAGADHREHRRASDRRRASAKLTVETPPAARPADE